MTQKIHQLIPGMNVGDAVTAHALGIQKILRNLGYQSLIFSVARHVSLHLKAASLDYREHVSNPHHILIYHFSIGSELSAYFTQVQDKKIMIYHNITPDRYFQGINDQKALVAQEGRQQLKTLASVPQLALGVSEYNRRELEQMGYRHTGVFPLIVDFSSWNGSKVNALVRKYRDGKTNFLFVGRIVPNKKIEDVIRVFYYYQKTIEPLSRLIFVGPYTGMERYYGYLKAYIMELGLKDVVFTGHVSDVDLKTYYQISDLFLCMSEHEGFCIPLLEAMYFGLPVVAYDACAVAETLGNAGILVKEKNFKQIAELSHHILCQEAVRQSIVSTQKRRLQDFSERKTETLLKEYVEKIIS